MSDLNRSNWMRSWMWNIICVGFVFVPIPVVGAAPGDTDNAALMYYQAFMLCPDPDSILNEQEDPHAVYRHDASIEDIEQYREYAEDYQHIIQLVRAATSMQQCDWTIPDQQGPEVRAERWRAIRSLKFLIGANVHVLASDGDYKSALSDSLMLRRLARHLADDPDKEGPYYSAQVLVERTALLLVNRVLDVMPADEMILKWLREQLADQPPVSEPFSSKMKQDFEWQIRTIRTKGRSLLPILRQELADKAANEEQRQKILGLTDEELIGLIREPYAKFLDSVFAALNRGRPYEETYTEIERQVQEYCAQAKNNPAIILTLQGNAEMWSRLYAVRATHIARFNAVKAAIEIYLHKATNGQLPQTLPDGLPKDPLSGSDFEYKITEVGFTLRSSSYQVKDIQRYDIPEYEFKVHE